MQILTNTTRCTISDSKVLKSYQDNNSDLLQPMSQSNTIMITNNVSKEFFNRSISGSSGNGNKNLEGAIGNHFLSSIVNTSLNAIVDKNVFINTNINSGLNSKQSGAHLKQNYDRANNTTIENDCEYSNSFARCFTGSRNNITSLYTMQALYSSQKNNISKKNFQNGKCGNVSYQYHEDQPIQKGSKQTISSSNNVSSDTFALPSVTQADVTRSLKSVAEKKIGSTLPFIFTSQEKAEIALLGIKCPPNPANTSEESAEECSQENPKSYSEPDITQDCKNNKAIFTGIEKNNIVTKRKRPVVIAAIKGLDFEEGNMVSHFQWKYTGKHVTNGKNVNCLTMNDHHHIGVLNVCDQKYLGRPLELVWNKHPGTNLFAPIDVQRFASPKLLQNQLLDTEIDQHLKPMQFITCSNSWEYFTFTKSVISDIFN